MFWGETSAKDDWLSSFANQIYLIVTRWWSGITWRSDILTGSLKTVHVTASLHSGVVSEPLYRKYLALSLGSMGSNVNGSIVTFDSDEINGAKQLIEYCVHRGGYLWRSKQRFEKAVIVCIALCAMHAWNASSRSTRRETGVIVAAHLWIRISQKKTSLSAFSFQLILHREGDPRFG